MSNNSVNLEERILPTAVGFQAMTVTETKSWEFNRICMSPKHSACSVVRCMYTTHTWASAVWIADREFPKCMQRILC